MTSTPPAKPPSAADLHAQLDQSQSTIIYLDLGEIDDAAVDEFLVAEGLVLERDVVRALWSVRKASEDEVADAAASQASTSTPSAPTPTSSTSTSHSSTPPTTSTSSTPAA